MNKHALSTTVIAIAILIILFILVMFSFITSFSQKTTGLAVEEKCRLSVDREAAVNVVAKQTGAGHAVRDFAGNIECQTIPVNITEKNPDAVIRLTRAFMEKCWKLFGAGTLELFSRGSGTFCDICYVLRYRSVSSVALAAGLQGSATPLQGRYDVPAQTSGEFQAVVFVSQPGAGAQKIAVRSLDKVGEVCGPDAVFPRQLA